MSRKQREIANRHALFLEIGRGILEEEGYHLLSMERIAEVAEYSKGTVYQHFTCKEEILIQLCNEDKQELLALFKRAAEIEGTNRDRMFAVFYGHQLWANNHCCETKNKTDMMQHLSMHGVLDKVTESSRKLHEELQLAMVGLVNSIVDQALLNGDLNKSKHLHASEIVFGLWSLSTGGHTLQASELPLDEFGVRDPGMTLIRTMILIFDGLGWHPLHSEAHLKKLMKQLNTQVFAEEFAQWNSAG